MGLDIYVGTFTRYYQRDWQTVTQRMIPGKVTTIRPNEDPNDPPDDPEEIRGAIALWTQDLASALKLPSPWSEDAAMPYFTDKPNWDGFHALLLWAALDDQQIDPQSRREPKTAADWMNDPILYRYQDPRVETSYAQLLLGQQIWLPIPAPSAFKSTDPAGNPRMFGNCNKLLAELNLLNSRTRISNPALNSAASSTAQSNQQPQQLPLEAAARFAFQITHRLATEAVAHKLPIILDY